MRPADVRDSPAVFPAHWDKPNFEFHASEIFGGIGYFRGIPPAQRVRLYNDILSLVATFGCRIFYRGINKDKLHARAKEKGFNIIHPHELASQFLFEGIDVYLEGLSRKDGHMVLGLIVEDEQKEMCDKMISHFAQWKNTGTALGYKTRILTNLIDTIHYVPSNSSWMIQLADCVAFIRNRIYCIQAKQGFDETKYDESAQAVYALWSKHCMPNIEDGRIWPE